jgi:mannose-6-phosphate isomerase-like protein (cupin superfamily)
LSNSPEIQPLTSNLLDTVRDYCVAIATNDKKTSSKIASFATLHEPGLRYWIDHANRIIRQSRQDNGGEIDYEAISNALILQNLTSQLSLFPPDDIGCDKFLELVKQSTLSDTFLNRYAAFGDDDYVRKLILQTKFLSVYVIGWRPGQESWMHHHGNSLDVIYVVEGEMTHWMIPPDSWEKKKIPIPFEGGFLEKYEGESAQIDKGQFIAIPRRHAHQIVNMSDKNLVTLHVRWGQPPDDDKWEPKETLSMDRLMFEWEQAEPCRVQQP